MSPRTDEIQVNNSASSSNRLTTDELGPQPVLNGRIARSRRDRPCDVCRRRKIRCFIEQGQSGCALCKAENFNCTFDEPPVKRQRKQSDAVNRGPTLPPIGSTSPPAHPPIIPTFDSSRITNESPRLSVLAELSHAPWATGTTRESPTSISVASHSPQFGQTEIDPPPLINEALARVAAGSNASPSSQSPTSPGEPTLNLYNGTTVQFVGPSGDNASDYLTPNDSSNPNQPTQELSISHDNSDPVHFKLVRQEEVDLEEHEHLGGNYFKSRLTSEAEVMRVISRYGPPLVKLYFKLVHPSLPVANPQRVQGRIHELLSAQTPLPFDYASTPLIASIMVVASHWVRFDPSVVHHPTGGDLSVLKAFISQSLTIDTRLPRLTTVQALLLKYSMLTSTAAPPSALETWGQMGTLVATAQNLGLQQEPRRWGLSSWEISLRRRLWWAVFTTEKWLAHSLGRPSNVHHDSWNVSPLEVADFEVFDAGAEHFMHLADLTLILSDTLDSLYSTRAVPTLIADSRLTISIAEPLLERADAWLARLPAQLVALGGAESQDDPADNLQLTGSLHLAYFAVKISLMRAILRCHGKVDYSYRLRAIETMEAVANFIRQLTTKHILSIWFSHSKHSLMIATNWMLGILFTSATHEEFLSLRKTVQSFRWHLRIHSHLFPELFNPALKRLDSLCPGGVDRMEQIWQHQFETGSRNGNDASTPNTKDGNGTELERLLSLAHTPSTHAHNEDAEGGDTLGDLATFDLLFGGRQDLFSHIDSLPTSPKQDFLLEEWMASNYWTFGEETGHAGTSDQRLIGGSNFANNVDWSL